MQWFSIYYSYLSSLDIAFKMSNRSKQARIVPETPDNSSSDDDQEQEGEELQVGILFKILSLCHKEPAKGKKCP